MVDRDVRAAELVGEALRGSAAAIERLDDPHALAAYVERAPCDLLVLALRDGDLAAAGALRALRNRDDGLCRLPVVALVDGVLCVEERARLEGEGPVRILERPFRVSDLRRAAHDLCEGA